MEKSPNISVIIPAYNEEANIPYLLAELTSMISKSNLSYEVILVDDGSDDKTFDVAKELVRGSNFIKLIHHSHNLGKTEAILSGFKVSSGKFLVIMDADLQYSPSDIPKLVNKLEDGFDIVTGWKRGKYKKKFVSWVYNRLSNWLFKIPIHDQNAIKVLRREVLESLQIRKDWHRYIVALACDKGYRVGEIEVELRPRKYGKSKYSGPGRIIIGILDLLAVKFQVSFMKKPLLLFGTIGSLFFIAGGILGVVILYQRFVLHHGFRPLLYLVMLLIIVGLMLFMLGFLAESIVGIHNEIQGLKKDKR